MTPIDIIELGINATIKRIISKCGSRKVYMSIDLDCMDPGVAPGVSVPASWRIISSRHDIHDKKNK